MHSQEISLIRSYWKRNKYAAYIEEEEAQYSFMGDDVKNVSR